MKSPHVLIRALAIAIIISTTAGCYYTLDGIDEGDPQDRLDSYFPIPNGASWTYGYSRTRYFGPPTSIIGNATTGGRQYRTVDRSLDIVVQKLLRWSGDTLYACRTTDASTEYIAFVDGPVGTTWRVEYEESGQAHRIDYWIADKGSRTVVDTTYNDVVHVRLQYAVCSISSIGCDDWSPVFQDDVYYARGVGAIELYPWFYGSPLFLYERSF